MRQKMLRSKTLTGIALAVAAGCFWGTMAVSGQYMITACGFNAEELTTVRIAGAGILMLVLGMLTEKNFFGSLRYLAVCRDVCFYGLCLFVIQYTFFLAIHACNAGTAAIMVGFGPIFIILWNILVKRQKIVPKVGAFWCYLRSTEFIPPALTSILASFEPLSAVVLCVLLLGTSFNYVECIGAALIISNLFILSIPNDKFRAFFPRFRRAGLEN